MSDTPIYDQLSELRKLAHRNGAYQLKYEILKWAEAEIVAGRIKKTVDVEKLIKGIEGIKTWEASIAQQGSLSTGNGASTTSKTSGTSSKNRRSSEAPKKPSATSKRSSTKGK